MQKLLENKISECQMFINFFQDIINRNCEELKECVRIDLEYHEGVNLDEQILFSTDARNTFYKLNSPHAKTRNWLILDSLNKRMNKG